MRTLFQVLEKILREEYEIDINTINPDAPIEMYGFTSSAILVLGREFCAECNVPYDEEKWFKVKKFNDIADRVFKETAKKPTESNREEDIPLSEDYIRRQRIKLWQEDRNQQDGYDLAVAKLKERYRN